MKQHRKIARILLLTLLVALIAITFAACDSSGLTINFDVDGDTYYSITVKSEADFVEPQNPEKQGNVFQGWFWDKNVWKQPATIETGKELAKSNSTLTAYAKFSFDESQGPLTTPNGKLRVLQIADPQYSGTSGNIKDYDAALLSAMVKDANPDFIVLTGDNTSSEMVLKKSTLLEYHTQIAKLIGSFGIPWTTVFGNHDAGGPTKTTPKELYDCYVGKANFWGGYESNACFDIMNKTDALVADISIPVFDQNGKIVSNLLCLDTKTSVMSGGYEAIDQAQIDFYVAQGEKLKAMNGGQKVDQMMFTHIATPLFHFMTEFKNNANQTKVENSYYDYSYIHENFALAVENGAKTIEYKGHNGETKEQVGYAVKDANVFNFTNVMLARKDIKGIFVGHDHLSSAAGIYQPQANDDYQVMLAMSRQSGFGCGWYPGISDSYPRGGRIVDLNAETGSLTTYDIEMTNLKDWIEYNIVKDDQIVLN